MIRRRLTLLVWAALALLAACGPGVGGTGTGDKPGPALDPVLGPGDFGADAALVCDSTLADALACAGTGASGSPAPAGTAAVRWDSVAPDTPLVARFDGNALTLQGACTGLAFRGSWGIGAAGPARYYGSVVVASEADPQAGQVLITPQADGSLQLVVQDAGGLGLAGPLRLERVAELEAPGRACP